MTQSYTFGDATVSNGSDVVTGTGTAWLTANIAPGLFGLNEAGSPSVPVDEIISDTELRLVQPWRGENATGSAYWISYDTRDGQQTVNNAQRLAEYVARLDSDSLSSIAGLTPASETFIKFTGPNSAVLVPAEDIGGGGGGGAADAQVPNLAARAVYDGEAAGFSVLVSDIGGGVAALYSKRTNATADWSTAARFTGPVGAQGIQGIQGAKGDKGDQGERGLQGTQGVAGPYTNVVAGTVTTLPAGSNATVTPSTPTPGTTALNFGIPRGVDGTGAGTVTSVGVSVPTGFATSGSPIVSNGTIAINYASGYQGYTTTEANKLAGIAAGAQVNAVTSVAGRAGAVVLAKSDVGLGNVDNTSDASKPVSSATQTALNAKANTSSLGAAAFLGVGTTAGTVASGNDARLIDNAKLSVESQVLAGGASVTTLVLPTTTAGSTVTIDPSRRPMQSISNAGAFTLTATPTIRGYTILQIFNVAGAGAITFSGWAKVAGDAFVTDQGALFYAYIVNPGGNPLITLQRVY